MSGVTQELIEQPFGPDYHVYEAASRFGPESKGLVVEHLPTKKFAWTGGYMSISDAFERLQKIRR